MFPIAIVGAVIGMAVSGTKGAEWVSDKLGITKGGGSAGSKAGPTALTEKQASSFAAALAAQNTQQSLPPSIPVATAPAAVQPSSGTDYALFDRLKAGTMAYNQIGKHNGMHAGAIEQLGPNGSI
jgi:hypothetical protein